MNRSHVLIALGLVPLPWFLLWTTFAALAAPRYFWVKQRASELSLLGGGPRLLLSVAAIGSGAAFVCFGNGLWLRNNRRFAVGATAWIVFGAAMVSNGIWPMGDARHGLYGIGIANLIAPAFVCLEDAELRADRTVYIATAFVSVAALIYLWATLTDFDPRQARGLTQRLFSSINSAWPFLVACKLILRSGESTDRQISSVRVDPARRNSRHLGN